MSEPQAPLEFFAQEGRSALLAQVRRRIGTGLGRSLDAEDVVQESLLTALRVNGMEWTDSRPALASFLRKVADLRVKHEGRKARVRRAQTLVGEPPDAGARDAAWTEPGLCGPLGTDLRPEHRWSLFLKDWMEAPWPTARLLLERPTDGAVRSLHQRARAELVERIRD